MVADSAENDAACRTCGHARWGHIYGEGACRPGWVCEARCAEYASRRLRPRHAFHWFAWKFGKALYPPRVAQIRPLPSTAGDAEATLREVRSLADIYATGAHAENVLRRIREALDTRPISPGVING